MWDNFSAPSSGGHALHAGLSQVGCVDNGAEQRHSRELMSEIQPRSSMTPTRRLTGSRISVVNGRTWRAEEAIRIRRVGSGSLRLQTSRATQGLLPTSSPHLFLLLVLHALILLAPRMFR